MRALLLLGFTFFVSLSAVAQEDAERDQRLADYLSGVQFVGHFTVTGQPLDDLKSEKYEIKKVEKLAEEDLFKFTARIRYGDTDSELPIVLKVKWAGQTPVLTLDDVWLPGLGRFGARVVIHDDKYAGTWQHDDKGGHIFGRIEKSEGADSP